jgi:pyruvate/2-oxoglutarate dehydrogenase complex dihydrolipoamide dehydrogenase (E3) component
MQAAERVWAIGDVTGIWPLTHVGEYQGDVVASNILGEPRAANFEAVATLAIRAQVPLEVLRDTIQPFPTFSEIYNAALKDLRTRSGPGCQGTSRVGPG